MKLPDDVQYIPDFLPGHRDLFPDLLDEFFSLEPLPILLGGSRHTMVAVANDRPNRYTETVGMEGGRSLRRLLWRPLTGFLAGKIETVTGVRPTIAVFNLYRDGDDYIDFHLDGDAAHGPRVDDVVIATVSFGASRLLEMRRIDKTAEALVRLEAGSLFVMRGKVQQQWLHAIHKTDDDTGARLSITFFQPQRDPSEKFSWSLNMLPPEYVAYSEGGANPIEIIDRDDPLSAPMPVLVGSREEVFAEWCRRDGETLAASGSAVTMDYMKLDDMFRESVVPSADDEDSLEDHIPVDAAPGCAERLRELAATFRPLPEYVPAV